ncbi:hypothetical protein [Bacillus sp. SM2101]|uniref:hypothetical protein n=1 Tax=Bacillus sp. SM2101 TaxID=2805366 RepID=UPI001BDE0BBD|nr:hypothetical protein [Bacillus sp. SM2101]
MPYKTLSEVPVLLDNSILEKYQLEGIIISPITKGIGILLLSEQSEYTLRIYLITKAPAERNFKISHELESFQFPTEKDKMNFIERLPEMPAIELMLAINPPPQNITN